MNPERWRAVGELFEQAAALPPAEQTVCVERASAGDDELRREVLSLLANHKALPGGFVQEKIKDAVVSFYQANLAHPTSIGPYRVIRELGKGGMGTVFLGERSDGENETRVAIKLVRPGMDTEFILARFRRERQTLARMQHPNIARLLDSGSTNQGLPYIVMEYVDGLRITDHARQQKLGIEARIVLLLSVCAAVDYAHRNFVIHRDIKPGNILVGPDDIPKLLDFGICKLLADPLSDVTTSDTVAGAMLTPSYASPEQVRGEAVTLLSDVYSLGVVLYELLTDTSFAKFNRRGQADPVMQVSFPRASEVVADRALRRRLSGDLDNILVRALEADPQRRYESAALLADDLRRHLLDQPILARPQNLPYKASKFTRRNRAQIAAAAVVIVVLLAIVNLASRGRQSRTPVKAEVGSLYSSPRDPNALTELRDGTTEVKEVMASHAQSALASAELYRALASQELGDREAQAGNLAEAKRSYEESVSLAEVHLQASDPAFLIVYIGSSRKLGLNAVARGERDQALEFGRHAVAASTRAQDDSSARELASARAASAVALIYVELLSNPLRQPDDREQAIYWFRKSVDAWHQAAAKTRLHPLEQQEIQETERALKFFEGK
jgi:serine/threonine protein kinase